MGRGREGEQEGKGRGDEGREEEGPGPPNILAYNRPWKAYWRESKEALSGPISSSMSGVDGSD